MTYASTAEIKAALRITDSTDDTLVAAAGSASSELIDNYTNRTFTSAGTAWRWFAPTDPDVLIIDDLQTATTVIQTATAVDGVYGAAWAATDYQLEGASASSPFTRVRAVAAETFPVSTGEATVRIQGVWGWAAVPASIAQACIIQACRLFKRLDSPLGVAGFGDLGVIRVSRGLDPDVAQLVEPFRRFDGMG